MNEHQLSLNLVAAGVLIDPYWFNMEIKKDALQDGMTVAEAATVIDATYNIKACEPAETQQHDIWTPTDSGTNKNIWTDAKNTIAEAADTLEAKKRFAASLSDYTQNCAHSLLAIPELIAYDVTLKIFRSHQSELYKLQMANGTAGPAIKFEGRVVHTVDIDNASSHTFDNPIIRRPVMSWQGFSGPKIHIKGNTAYWEGTVNGILRAEFGTEWDEVTIHVTGDFADSSMIEGTDNSVMGTGWYSGSESGEEINDYQDVECSVLAFYHFEYEELILNKPEKDESTTETDKLNICHFVNSTKDDSSSGDEPGDDEEQAMCQQHVNETVVCQCDGDERHDGHYEPVVCPDGVRGGSTLQGSVDRRTYKDCGYRDKANNPAYYEDQCCELPAEAEVSLPLCMEMVTRFTGDGQGEVDRSKYPEGTNFVTVSPVDGQCGEHTVKQVVASNNCCVGVPAITWDDENSVEVMADNTQAVVAVTPGKGPYKWSVRGQGFTFTGGLRDIITDSNAAYIITENACGVAAIAVSDMCSSTSGAVKSTDGQWVLDPDGGGCVGGDMSSYSCGVNCTAYTWINKDRKQTQTVNLNDGSLVCKEGVSICADGYGSYPPCPTETGYCWCVTQNEYYKWVC